MVIIRVIMWLVVCMFIATIGKGIITTTIYNHACDNLCESRGGTRAPIYIETPDLCLCLTGKQFEIVERDTPIFRKD